MYADTSTHYCIGMQAGLADITESLKRYRPSVTVLEAQVAPSRRGEGAGGTSAPGLTAANGPDGGLVAVQYACYSCLLVIYVMPNTQASRLEDLHIWLHNCFLFLAFEACMMQM